MSEERFLLFEKIADKITRHMEIDWDLPNTESIEIEDAAISNIIFYEELLDEYNEDLSEGEMELIMKRLMEGYIALSIIERKRAIEELINGVL